MGWVAQAAIGQSGVGQYLNAAVGNQVLHNADAGLIFDGLSLDVLRTYRFFGAEFTIDVSTGVAAEVDWHK